MPFAEGQDDSEVDHDSAEALQHTFGTNNLDHLLTVHLFFLIRRLARCPLLHFQGTGISYEGRWIMTLPTLTYWTFYSDAYAIVNVLVSNASAFRTLSLLPVGQLFASLSVQASFYFTCLLSRSHDPEDKEEEWKGCIVALSTAINSLPALLARLPDISRRLPCSLSCTSPSSKVPV